MDELDVPQMKREVESLQYQLAINREKSSITVTEWVYSLTHTHTYTHLHTHRPNGRCVCVSGWWSGSRAVCVMIRSWTRSWWGPTPGWRRESVWSSKGLADARKYNHGCTPKDPPTHTHTHTHTHVHIHTFTMHFLIILHCYDYYKYLFGLPWMLF